MNMMATGRRWTEAEALHYAKLKAELVQQIKEETGDDVDGDDEFLIGSLEGMTDLTEMVNFLADRVRRNEAELDGLTVTAANYAEYMKAVIGKKKVQVDRGRKRLLNILEMVGQTKVGRVSKRAAGNPPLEFIDETKVPSKYMVQPPPPPAKPDKLALKAALKDPDLARELADVCRLGNGAPTLVID